MGSALSKHLKFSRGLPIALKKESEEFNYVTCNVPLEQADENTIIISEWVVIQIYGEVNAEDPEESFQKANTPNGEVRSTELQKTGLEDNNSANGEVKSTDLQKNDLVDFNSTSGEVNSTELQENDLEDTSSTNTRIVFCAGEVNSTELQRNDLEDTNSTNNVFERNLLDSISKYCDDWQNISEKLGFDKTYFYKKSRFVEYFTWLFWKAVLEVYKNGKHGIITYIERSLHVIVDYSFWDFDIPQFSKKDAITDFPKTIWEYIPRLKGFLRSFNIGETESYSSSNDQSYRVMELIGLNKIQSWNIWKRLLTQKLFGGHQIVEDIENDYPYLKNVEDSLSADESFILHELLHNKKFVGEFSEGTVFTTMEPSNRKNLSMPPDCDVKVAAFPLCKEAQKEECEDILEAIADKIDDVSSLSSILGFEEDLFENPLHLIENVTWLLWKFILHEDSSLVSEIENYFPHLKNNTKEFADLPLSNIHQSRYKDTDLSVSNIDQSSYEGAYELIKSNLSEWKEFGILLGVPGSKLEHLEDKYFDDTKNCADALMRQHCYPSDPVLCFDIWVKYLSKFENGRKVINRICYKYPTLLHPKYISVCELIKENLSDWKGLGRAIGVPDSKLEHLKDKFLNRTKDCVDTLMRQYCYPFDPVESFNFWVKYLLKFENGREVINKICDKYPTLIHPKYLTHAGNCNQNFMIMHHNYTSNKDFVKIEKYKEILVPITEEVIHYQSKEEFAVTSEKYHHRYEMIRDVKKLNFSEENKSCAILNSIEGFLNGDNGFVYKGYSLNNHCHLLADGIIPVEKSNNNIIAYIAKDGVLLHIKFCEGNKDDQKINSIRRISKEFVNDVRLAQSLHPCIQNNPIIHVGVVVCDKSLIANEKVLCKDCKEKGLLVEVQKLSTSSSFSEWYKKTVSQNNAFKGFKPPSKELSQKISKDLKENILIYMALDHYHLLPLFTNLSDCQMNEAKKLVYLTGCQMQIFFSPFKHKIIKGGYGSGKSIVLEKLFEATVSNSNEDIIFYICYDPMSKFHLYLQSILKNVKQKNVLVCNIQELSKSATLNLSSILKQIKNSLKSCRCHFFIDEFNGSQLTREEVDSLSLVLQGFKDSYINIAVQSFEYKEIGKNSDISGFQYNYLLEKTDFELFELDYSLRCTKEINHFVNDTIQILKSSKLKRPRNAHRFVASDNTVMDQEMADDKMSTKFHVERDLYEHSVMFNQPKELGHNISCKQVQKIEVNESLKTISNAKFVSDLEKAKLFNAIKCFLNDINIEYNKVAICAFDEVLYNALNIILLHLKIKFTARITEFQKVMSPYEVLLIDHASPRGFEFEHFIFVFGMEREYINYRLIECFTRATTNLYLVVNIEEEGIRNNNVAQELLKAWREHVCVYDLSHHIEEDNLTATPVELDYEIEGRDVALSTGEDVSGVQNQLAQVIEIDQNQIQSYRWSNAYSANEISDESTESDVNHMMELIFKKDNPIIFGLFVSSNTENVATYCRTLDNKSFLHIAAYHDSLNICKLLVEEYELKVNESFSNEPTPLEDAIKYNRFEITKYFLQHVKRHELLETYFEKLIKVAKNNGNAVIEEYLQTTFQQNVDC